MFGKFGLLAFAALVLAGCANARDPNPVSLKQAGDHELSCRNIEIEYKTNTEVAANKITKNNGDDGRDVLLGVLIWPGLADFKNAEGTEGNALIDRNVYLRELARSKDCDIRSWPTQPNRYS